MSMFANAMESIATCVFALSHALFVNSQSVAQTVVDLQAKHDVEYAESTENIDRYMSGSSTQKRALAFECMCGCFSRGIQCPTLSAYWCKAMCSLRIRRWVKSLFMLILLVKLLFFASSALWTQMTMNWPSGGDFRAAVPARLDDKATDIELELLLLRNKLLDHLDTHKELCGAIGSDLGEYVSLFLIKSTEHQELRESCPSFAARCEDTHIIFELLNPVIVKDAMPVGTELSSTNTVVTKSLLCENTCSRQETFKNYITVVFSSRSGGLHKLDFRKEAAYCFQHHLKVAQGEWPCLEC